MSRTEVDINIQAGSEIEGQLDHSSLESPLPNSSKPKDLVASQPHLEPLEIAENNARDDDEYLMGSKFFFTGLALGLTLVLVGLDNSIIATAIPTITNHFKTIKDIGWYSVAFRLTMCSFQFMFGKMYTLFSAKYVYLSSLVIFETGSLLCAVAPRSSILVLGRAIAGFGTAGIISGIFTIITQSVPLRFRSLAGGIGGAAEGIAATAAPLIGGLITDTVGWRWCFYINLPLGAATFIVTALTFTNPRVNQEALALSFKEKLTKMDLVGTAVFVPCIISLLLALQWGGTTYGWGDARIIVLFILFTLMIGVFAWLQWRMQESATLPPRIILHRSVLSGMLFSCCNNSAMSIVEYYMPIYFQAVKGVSASRSGVLGLPMIMGFISFLLLGGSLTSVVGYYTPFMLLTSLLTPISAGLLTTLAVDAPLSSLIIYQALLGIGCGIGFQSPQVAAQTVLNPRDAPMGIAAIIFAQSFGPAIFVASAQSLFTSRLVADLGKYAPELNATALQTVGLSDLKELIGPENLAGALLGYDKAVTQTFFLVVGLACVTLVGSLAMEWRSVKQKKT